MTLILFSKVVTTTVIFMLAITSVASLIRVESDSNINEYHFQKEMISTLSATTEDIEINFSNQESKEIINGDLKNTFKEVLLEKTKRGALSNPKYIVTDVQYEDGFGISSLTNYYHQDEEIFDQELGHYSEHKHDNSPREYFNIFFLKEGNSWKASLNDDFSKTDEIVKKRSANSLAKIASEISLETKKSKQPSIQGSSQNYRKYKFPWDVGQKWRVETVNTKGQPWGWHNDKTGPSLDFLPPNSKKSYNIRAASDGLVTWRCTTDRSRNQAGVHILTKVDGKSYNETLRYYHLRRDAIYVGYESVSQGERLGKLAVGTAASYSPCNMLSRNTHLHLGLPKKGFLIDGVFFGNDLGVSSCDLVSSQGKPHVSNENIFPDVPDHYGFGSYIKELKEDGVIGGYSDGCFKSGNNLDRAAMAKFIYNGFNFTPNTSCGDFPDVPTSSGFYTFITTLKCEGIIGGFSDGTFKPSVKVDRGASMKFTINALRQKAANPSDFDYNSTIINPFSDIKESDSFYEFIVVAAEQGIIGGYPDGTFQKNTKLSRGAMSKIIANARNSI
jgi:hypothetical protein